MVRGNGAIFLAVASLAAASDGTMEFAMKRKHVARRAEPIHRRTDRRDDSLLRPLHFNDHWLAPGGYFIDVDIGTPPQHLEVLIDTGSSNLFVADSQAAPCLQHNCPGGSFDSSASSTFKNVQTPYIFNITYGDGSQELGNYSTDTVSLSGATLPDLEFGIANPIQVSPNDGPDAAQYGIMGVGFEANEASACQMLDPPEPACDYSFSFPTVPEALYNAGYIKSRSYSMYMDNVQEGKSSLLFGGIDTAKFSGQLDTLAIQPDVAGDPQNGTYTSLDILVTSISATINGTSAQLTPSTYSATGTIDTGAADLSVPESVFDVIFNNILSPLGAVMLNGDNVMPCAAATSSDFHITFGLTGFDGAQTSVNIPIWAFLIPYFGNATYNATSPVTNSAGDELCLITLGPDDSASYTVGDPLFRSAYINFNLDEKKISFAQAVYGTTSSNIVTVGPGPVPSLVGTGNAVDSWNSTSGIIGLNPPTSSASGTGAPMPTGSITPYTGGASIATASSWWLSAALATLVLAFS